MLTDARALLRRCHRGRDVRTQCAQACKGPLRSRKGAAHNTGNTLKHTAFTIIIISMAYIVKDVEFFVDVRRQRRGLALRRHQAHDLDLRIGNDLLPVLNFPRHRDPMGLARGAEGNEGTNAEEAQDILGNDIGVVEEVGVWGRVDWSHARCLLR